MVSADTKKTSITEFLLDVVLLGLLCFSGPVIDIVDFVEFFILREFYNVITEVGM